MTGYFLSGLVEIPAGIISPLLLHWYGRKTVTFFALAAQCASMLGAVLFPGKSYVSMAFPLAAKTFNSVAWAAEPLLLGEMSPTSLRNVFYGSVGFVGEVGSVVAPYLNTMVREIKETGTLIVLFNWIPEGFPRVGAVSAHLRDVTDRSVSSALLPRD